MFGLMGLRGSGGLGLDTVVAMAAVDWTMERRYRIMDRMCQTRAEEREGLGKSD